MGGKFKNLFALVLATFAIIINANANYDISNDDFIKNKDQVVVGSSLEIMCDEYIEDMTIVFTSPSGQEESLEFTLDDDTGLPKASIVPSEAGNYTSKKIIAKGEEKDFESLSFEAVASAADIFNEEKSLYITDDMPSQVNSDELIQNLTKVKFFDENAEGLLVNIRIENDSNTYLFETDNDGFTSSATVLTDDEVLPGKYTASFTSNGETYKKEIEIISDQVNSLSANVRLSELNRVFGPTRTDTAINVSKSVYTKSKWAVLTNGDSYGDTLVGVALAAAVDGPVLFSGSESLNQATADELTRLGVENVYLIGGGSAIKARVQKELEDMSINVSRVSGMDSIDTANNTAKEVAKYSDFDKAILADADNYPDALASTPLAAEERIPIFFTKTQGLDNNTIATMKDLGVKEVLIVGGVNSVSNNVAKQLSANGIDNSRISGSDRYETAVNFANIYYPEYDNLVIASGEKWPDAIIGGVLAYKNQAPIILTRENRNPTGVKEMVGKVDDGKIFVLGGTGTISQAVYDEIDRFIPDAEIPEIKESPSEPIEEPTEEPKIEKDQPKETTNANSTSTSGPIKIFIDQGHGWNYNKGVVDGYYEGNAMYWYGLILRNELREYGFIVDCFRNDLDAERRYCIENGLTNTNGRNVSLRGPEAAGYDLLLSVHSNAHNDSKVWGTEVFDSAQSPNYELAKDISSVISNHFQHNNRGVKYRYYDDGSVTYGEISDDQRGTDWYGVLRSSAAPSAMLIEHGFHTNYHDCTKLMNADFKHEMASKTAKVIADFYGYSK